MLSLCFPTDSGASLEEVGSGLVTGRSATCSCLAGFGIAGEKESSQRAIFNTTILKTVRGEGQPNNIALVTKILGYKMVCWLFTSNVVGAMLWQDLPNLPFSTNVKQQHQPSKQHWSLMRKCNVQGNIEINDIKLYDQYKIFLEYM